MQFTRFHQGHFVILCQNNCFPFRRSVAYLSAASNQTSNSLHLSSSVFLITKFVFHFCYFCAKKTEKQMAATFKRRSNSEILITKDLLGGLSSNPESDHNSKIEHASHERCSSPNSPLSSSLLSNHQKQTNPDADFQSLNLINYPQSSSSSSSSSLSVAATTQINRFEETCLDLKLQSLSSSNYQSVCTLDKVKSALQRAEKETAKKRPSPSPSPSAMFAAACPGCLMYVITLKTNPKCPRCNSSVPSPTLLKKAKIDLNSSV